MKNLWSKNLASKVILVFVSLIFWVVDIAASPKIAGKPAALESRVANRNVSTVQRSPPKKGKLRKTVVTLYLSEKLNVLLRPKLLAELRPGSRILSHDFRMGEWKPEQTVRVPWGKLYRTIYFWTVPAKSRATKRRR